MIEVTALRESYNSFEIEKPGLVGGKMKIAFDLTNNIPSPLVDTMLSNSRDETAVLRRFSSRITAEAGI